MKTPDEKGCKILVVDDEENILIGFKKAFKDEFNIETVNSAEEAIKYLEKDQAIGVVLTDQRMAGMNGVKLLTILKAKYPNIVRILITGYSDIMVAIDAINNGDVFRYIHKPIKQEIVTDTLKEAVNKYSINKEQHDALNKTMAYLQKETARAMENYTAWMAHNINNSLQAVKTYVDLSSPRFNKDTSETEFAKLAKGYVEQIAEAIHRMEDIHRHGLEHFVRGKVSVLLLFENHELSKMIADKKITVKKEIRDPDLEIMVNPMAIQEVFRKLVTNSIEASPEGATIEVAAAKHQSDGYPAVMFLVRDSGKGISPEIKGKLFYPFIKVDGEKKLRGLGLSYVQATIARHGGDILVDTAVGKGTSVSFSLPIIQPEKQVPETQAEKELDRKAREMLKKNRR